MPALRPCQCRPEGLDAGIKAKTGRIAGAVALVAGSPGAGSQEERAAGFRAQIAARYPELRLVADRVADGRAATGRPHSLSPRRGTEASTKARKRL